MKLSIGLSELVMGVNTVCKSISNRTTLPILENIYMKLTDNNELLMRGNDLELGIEYLLPVDVETTSNSKDVLIKSNTLSDIISKMSSDKITLSLDEQFKTNIQTNNVDFDIFGVSSSEYPEFPKIEKDVQFNLKSDVLLNLIRHTIFSVSYDETKQFLNGIKIESKNNRCDFISTDGFRLSIKYHEFQEDIPEFSCIVPYKTMNELAKILTNLKVDTVQVYLSERQISF